MKTWHACLTVVMLLTLQSVAEAQPRAKGTRTSASPSTDQAKKSTAQNSEFVYLEVDDIFAEAATVETNNQINDAASQEFGRSVAGELGASRKLEPKAAKLLLELQANSNAKAVVEKWSVNNPRPERKLMRADIFIAAYTLALVKLNAQSTEQGSQDERAILSYARKQLLEGEVQQSLLEYARKELGTASDPAAKTIELSVTLQAELSVEKQNKLSVAIKAGDRTAMLALSLPPPLCIIFRCCN
jgi:hypothetical protein